MTAAPAPPADMAPPAERRPMFFMLTNGVIYPVLVTLFPFVLPYVMNDINAYSRLIVYTNAMVLLQELLTLGLGRGVTQLAIQTPEDRLAADLPAPLRGVQLMLLLEVALATAAVGWMWLVRPGPAWFEHNGWLLFWFWLGVASQLVRIVTQSLLYGTRRFRSFVAFDLAWAALRLVAVPVCWKLGGQSGALAATALLLVLTCLPAFPLLARGGVRVRGGWAAGWQAWRYYFQFGLWLQMASLAGSLLRPCVVLVLAWMYGQQAPQPGYANLTLSLFMLVMVLLDALFMGLYPEKARLGAEAAAVAARDPVAEQAARPDARLLRSAVTEARVLGFICMPVAWLGMLLAPWGALLLRDNFHAVGAWVAVIALALPARGMTQPFIIALQAGHRPGLGARWQWVRLALVLAGLAVGLFIKREHPLAPMWGILAGEWLGTLLLIAWATWRLPAHSGMTRTWLIMTLFATGSALLVALPGRGLTHWLALLLPLAWVLLLPVLRLITWREVRTLFRPHHPAMDGTPA